MLRPVITSDLPLLGTCCLRQGDPAVYQPLRPARQQVQGADQILVKALGIEAFAREVEESGNTATARHN